MKWKEIAPNLNHAWITEGLSVDFEKMLPIGTKESKAGLGHSIFRLYSLGVATNRDAWAYNFNGQELKNNIQRTIEVHNSHVLKWASLTQKPNIDDFVDNDDSRISWTGGLKDLMQRGTSLGYDNSHIRDAQYRPLAKMFVYFDPYLNQRRYQMHHIFPVPYAQSENRLICLTGRGFEKPFSVLMTDTFVDISFFGFGRAAQCFPFYEYDEDGSNRRENITDWAVQQFQSALNIELDKWQIFHYVYGLLHSPEYREKYKANLNRELPRIPLPKTIEQFHAFVSAGEELARLHVDYESQKEYPLEKIENPDKTLNWQVEKMKLTKDKTAIVYNDFLTLAGIPPEAFEYRLGNRSALEWIIDRYQVHTDKRSGIVNDPNRADDHQYIVRLIGTIVTVSMETMRIVKSLPGL